MTPADLISCRQALGLSAQGLADLVQVSDGRSVRRWEAGDCAVPGPVAALLTAIMESPAVRAHFGLTLPEGPI